MRYIIFGAIMMIMPFVVHAHQNEENQPSCHESADGFIHCHVSNEQEK